MRTMDDTTAPSVIDQLRKEVENEHRFKTSLNGYSKTEVNAYLEKFQKRFQDTVAAAEAECQKLRDQNAALTQKLGTLQSEYDGAKAREKSRERAYQEMEQRVQESLLNSLRAENSKLQQENRYKQIEITNLQEQYSGLLDTVSGSSRELFSVSGRLEELLRSKMQECEDLLQIWNKETQGIMDSIYAHAQKKEENAIYLIEQKK